MQSVLTTVLVLLLLPIVGCDRQRVSAEAQDDDNIRNPSQQQRITMNQNEQQGPEGAEKGLTIDSAIVGAGCFWCVEAVFELLDGVMEVEAGYAGGEIEHPTYEQVCSGNTGHAEVARIVYDPTKISYRELLEVFWQAHDPTTLNRQGADVGTQYRSAIFYQDEEQRVIAEESKQQAQRMFDKEIVTEIKPLDVFYAAEDYHQDYYQRNRNAPYCQMVIRPKLKKLDLE